VPLLHFSDLDQPGFRLTRKGRRVTVVSPDGAAVTDPGILQRVEALAIPPAWVSVWIAPSPDGHIQAFGYDARARRQYIYHPLYRARREEEKFRRLTQFAASLPAVRRRVEADMRRPGLGQEKVVATVVHLLDRTLIRVGNRSYAEQNGSFGLSTLRNRHVAVTSSTVRFAFRGKSGREWRLGVEDRRVARVIRACQSLPGQHLFQYLDPTGERRSVTSDDVNGYLRDICRAEVSAKDFRTWAGTVLCGVALSMAPPDDRERFRKRQLASAIRAVAHRLGNTPAVCRSYYVHPAIYEAFESGRLHRDARRLQHPWPDNPRHSPAERAILRLLRSRKDEG